MKTTSVLLLSLILTSTIFAANSRDIRANKHFTAGLTWSPVNFPFPGAKGVSGYYIHNADWMYGLDYLSSNIAVSALSFDVGEITERNYTFQAKRFFGNSLNMLFGVGSRTTTTNLAADLFDLVTNNYSETASVIETQYIRFGIGNQWNYSNNTTFSVDWFSIDIPFRANVNVSASHYASTAANRVKIEDAESILKFYPGVAAVKLHFGYVF